jgi:riboflavin synthase
MFTGIVETVGEIASVTPRGDVRVIRVKAPGVLDDVVLGDSIALDGACQTVVRLDSEAFDVEAGPETLRLTTLGSWKPGRPVNVERSLKVGSRLGGHWVLGHVDGTARVVERRDGIETTEIFLSFSPEFAPEITRKGSVAIDGISLTVTSVTKDTFGVAVIPFTLAHTTLRDRKPGDVLNLETDVLAKYVHGMKDTDQGGLDTSLLERAGFM